MTKNLIKKDKAGKVIIVGAGVAGLSLGSLLAMNNYEVEIYDKSIDPRNTLSQKHQGKSVNFTISERGGRLLRRLGVWQKVQRVSTHLTGRVIYKKGCKPEVQKYSMGDQNPLRSIKRRDLVKLLIDCAVRNSVKIFFRYDFVNISSDEKIINFYNHKKFRTKNIKDFDFIVGADGVFSKVRSVINLRNPSILTQRQLEYFYKEIQVSKNNDISLDSNLLHVWPLKNGVIVAMPNVDTSFTLNIILDVNRETNFESIKTEADIEKLFLNEAPELLKIGRSNYKNFLKNSPQAIIETYTDKWHHKNKIILIGDSCHSVSPFLGQGMNSALEDSEILTDFILESKCNYQYAFSRFQNMRKEDTDCLVRFAYQHLSSFGQTTFLTRLNSELDNKLYKFFGKRFTPFYTLIAHTNERYSKISRIVRIQKIVKVIILFICPFGYLGKYFMEKTESVLHDK